MEHKFYKSVITISAVKDDSGYWTVIQNVSQNRSTDGTEWETKEVSVKALDKDLSYANSVCTISLEKYLSDVGGDLFSPQPVEKSEVTEKVM